MITDLLSHALYGPAYKANVPNPGDDRYYSNVEDAGIFASSGILVSPEQALRVITAFSCVRYIAETLASLPFTIFERNATDPRKKEEARDHPLWLLFHFKPNRWQSPLEFFEMLTGHAALRGNGYARIIPGAQGSVEELIPLHPGRMQVKQLRNYRLQYKYTDDHGQPQTYMQEEIFHLRGFGSDGVVGLSPVMLAKEALGLAAAAEGYGARFFGGYARPGGVLEHPGKLGKESRERLRRQWQELHAGLHNAHKVAILEEGLKWHQVGMTSEDAQFLETRKYQRSEIAALWRVPPHKVGIMDNATFTNIEHQGIEAVTDCMMPWARRWETAIVRDLITEPETFFPKVKLQGLLRGDTQARYSAYSTAHSTGWLNVNEIRELEDYNPIEGGEEYLKPMNMAPVGKKPLEQQQEEDRAKALAPDLWVFLADAAERIANHEIRELTKRTAKMGDREKFVEWVEMFYEDHMFYVSRVLAPFMSECGLAEGAIARVIATGREAWMAKILPQLPLWSGARAGEIVQVLQVALHPPVLSLVPKKSHFEATTQEDGRVVIKKVYEA